MIRINDSLILFNFIICAIPISYLFLLKCALISYLPLLTYNIFIMTPKMHYVHIHFHQILLTQTYSKFQEIEIWKMLHTSCKHSSQSMHICISWKFACIHSIIYVLSHLCTIGVDLILVILQKRVIKLLS